jgi:glycosyltransferase involved in cell wall biosynthesis
MCRALDARGVSTVIATTDADGHERLSVPLGARTSWNGLNVLFFEREWSEAFKYSGSLARWLNEHVDEFSVVHIHAVLSHACLAAASAARHAGVPYIVRPLGTLDPWSLAQKPWKKRLLMNLGGLQLLRHASAIQYTSNREKRHVEDALGLSRGTVVPLGIADEWLMEPPISDAARAGNRYVLSLSRLHPVKNLDALIDAFADVTRSEDGWKLIVAGAGDDGYGDRLRALIRDRSLDDRVRLTGWVDGAMKKQLLREASVFALPSLHENFGVSLVEAMAAGVPCLVSDQVHLADTIAEANAGWVTGVSRAALAAVLSDALFGSDSRRARGAAARSVAARFSWTAVAGELADLYAAVIQTAPAASSGLRAHGSGLRA